MGHFGAFCKCMAEIKKVNEDRQTPYNDNYCE